MFAWMLGIQYYFLKYFLKKLYFDLNL